MTETAFGSVIVFFQDLGMYDVVLPFLLVFAIVYAILEKTKVFGTEEINIWEVLGLNTTTDNLSDDVLWNTIKFLIKGYIVRGNDIIFDEKVIKIFEGDSGNYSIISLRRRKLFSRIALAL